jgi:hypothetical protein
MLGGNKFDGGFYILGRLNYPVHGIQLQRPGCGEISQATSLPMGVLLDQNRVCWGLNGTAVGLVDT